MATFVGMVVGPKESQITENSLLLQEKDDGKGGIGTNRRDSWEEMAEKNQKKWLIGDKRTSCWETVAEEFAVKRPKSRQIGDRRHKSLLLFTLKVLSEEN